jgi:hypothetical protein
VGVPECEEEGNGEEDVEDEEDGVTPGDELNGGNFKDYAFSLDFHVAFVLEHDTAGLEGSLDMLSLFHFHINNDSKFRKRG